MIRGRREVVALVSTANIGHAIDRSIVVVDVDPRNGGDVATRGELPLTVRTITGGGGRSDIYLRCPTKLYGKLAQGIDYQAARWIRACAPEHAAHLRPAL